MSDNTTILPISHGGGGAAPRNKPRRRRKTIQGEQQSSLPLVNPKIDPRINPKVDSLYNLPHIDPRAEIKQKLRDKIHGRSMERIPAKARNDILEKSLKTMGIDQDKLRSDLEALNKMGGFTIDMKN